MITRRGLLIGGLAGGGLIVAYAATPRSFPLPLEPHEGEFAFGLWLKIGRDGMVTVAVPQLEMGQGVTTLLPQVAAWELGADWKKIAVEPAPPSGAYANVVLAGRWAPLWMPALPGLAEGDDAFLARSFAERNRFTVTAEGTSLAAYEQPLRIAAAAAREMLVMAAADRWDVDPHDCWCENGYVVNGKQKLRFGELAEDAADYDPPSSPVLRPEPLREKPADFPAGKAAKFPRLDAPSKVTGQAVFAGDVRLPDMVFAAIARGPIGQTRLSGFDDKRIAGLSGNVRLIKHDRWVAAVAGTWWEANRALEVLAPEFATRDAAQSDKMYGALDKAVRNAVTHRIETVGDPDEAMGDKPSLILRYDVSPALHGSLETASCTARLRDGKLELWLATQAPELAGAAAEALEIGVRDVILYPVPGGGSFDARLAHTHAVQAALIAKEVGKPVQLTWSRWQEHLGTLPRPPAAAILWAKTNDAGQVLAWKTRIATPPAHAEFGHRLFDADGPRKAMFEAEGEADPVAVAGAMPPYQIANMPVDHVPVALGLPAGRMRGQAHGFTAFFTERFIDELAS